ncbi:hypothetical protein BT96DRAFT_653787 [Gymnopus androsaceus JB14]|uniref:Uncharacterized protein n=1 Tax=Gymnopus androsaceus JB14 TaxID=1447944 RepID=A0A6A4GFV6_9AGAR|nr:hypothetical protein BT96DRAFT_653787 [Gymnopus androsaceus JB14]
MPRFTQELSSLGFLEQIRGTLDTMTGSALYYLTAFLASSTVLPSNDAIKGVAGQYLLGLGIGDITGPVVETNMMGYASLPQTIPACTCVNEVALSLSPKKLILQTVSFSLMPVNLVTCDTNYSFPMDIHCLLNSYTDRRFAQISLWETPAFAAQSSPI